MTLCHDECRAIDYISSLEVKLYKAYELRNMGSGTVRS